ncbi:MAG: PAS domain S-box protein, partial [Promethearchaeota archaeon]
MVGLDRKGRIILFNKGCERVTGYSSSEAMGKSFFSLLLPRKHRTSVRRIFKNLIDGQAPVPRVQTWITKTGEERFIQWQYTVIPNAHGTVQEVLFIALDVTTRERADEAYRLIVERSRQGLLIIQDGHIVFANDAIAKMIGYTTFELLALTTEEVKELLCPDDREKVWERIEKTARGELTLSKYKCRFVQKDAAIRWFRVSSSLIKYRGKPAVQATLTDITGRMRAEAEIERIDRALRTLSKSNEALVRAENEPDLLNTICRILVEVGGYRFAWVGFANNDKDKTVSLVAKAGDEKGYLKTLSVSWASRTKGRTPTGKAISTRKITVARDIISDPANAQLRSEASQWGYSSIIALPLIADGQTLGALTIYAIEPKAFDLEERKLLKELSNDLAYGIIALRTRADHKLAVEELRESEFQYRNLFENMISGVAYHKIVLDSKGRPIDYIFLAMNDAFEQQTGLKRDDIIGKKVTEVLPGIEKEDFDWIGIYGRVALTGEPIQFEQYAAQLDRWYSVSAYRPEENHFVAVFNEITAQKQAEERREYLYNALQAIRNVNQLILRERDRDKLLQGACDLLIETRAYYNAWIALFEEDESLITAASGRSGEHFQKLEKMLKQGKLPLCCKKSLKQAGVHEFDILVTCKHCPIAETDVCEYKLTTRIEFQERAYGVLTISASHKIFSEEDRSLFKEVADDLGFALHTLELEEVRAQKEAELHIKDQAIATAASGIVITDLDAQITYANPAFLEMMGFTEMAEVLGKTPLDFMRNKMAAQKGLEALKSNGYFKHVINLVQQDGSTIYVQLEASRIIDVSGQPIGIRLSFLDITELKRAEGELRTSEEQFRLYFENVSDVILALDNQLRLISISPSVERILGYKPDQLVGKYFQDLKLFTQESYEKAYTDLKSLLNKEVVLDTGLGHGFHYRPIAGWVDPA